MGAVAGIGATVAMTAVMKLTQSAGAMGELPPQKIVKAMFKALGLPRSKNAITIATAAAHLGFGAFLGAAIGVLREARVVDPGKASAMKLATLVWAAAYQGAVPALGIMPRPKNDRPLRPTSMIAAHWVYGWTYDMLWRRLAA